MNKRIETISTDGGVSKITITKDRITVKIMPGDQNTLMLQNLACRCIEIDPIQSIRSKLDEVSVERGVIVMYTDKRKRIAGYLMFKDDGQPVRFVPNKE